MFINHDDRVLQVERLHLVDNSIEQREHLPVGVGTSAEKDQPGRLRMALGKKTRIVEVGGDDDSTFAARGGEDLLVGCCGKSHGRGMSRAVPARLEVRDRQWSDRHVNEELQPASSIVSSSARLAA
jgi:hypothetical protein